MLSKYSEKECILLYEVVQFDEEEFQWINCSSGLRCYFNLIEALINFELIRGKEHESYPKCIQAHEHKFEALSGGGFDVVGTKLREMHTNELISRRQENSLV